MQIYRFSQKSILWRKTSIFLFFSLSGSKTFFLHKIMSNNGGRVWMHHGEWQVDDLRKMNNINIYQNLLVGKTISKLELHPWISCQTNVFEIRQFFSFLSILTTNLNKLDNKPTTEMLALLLQINQHWKAFDYF